MIATNDVKPAAAPSSGVQSAPDQQATTPMGTAQVVVPSVGPQPLGGPGSTWMPGWSPYFMIPPWWFMPPGANVSTVAGWQWPFPQAAPTVSAFGGCLPDPAVVSSFWPGGHSVQSNPAASDKKE